MVDAVEACGIDYGKEQVAELGFDFFSLPELTAFSTSSASSRTFAPYFRGVFPVKAYIGGFFLYAERFLQEPEGQPEHRRVQSGCRLSP